MVLDLDHSASIAPSVVQSSTPKDKKVLVTIGWLTVLVWIALYLLALQKSSETSKLQIRIASDVAFNEDTPRTVQLIIKQANGRTETLTNHRYGSAFLDPRSSHVFSIPSL